MHHDRSVLVRLTDTGIQVEYMLALDGWTLGRDLVPFSKEVDLAGSEAELYKAYARIYGPRIAEGLVAGLDGQELTFRYVDADIQVEDHLRYTFRLQAPLTVGERDRHRLLITDSNFAFEPGVFKLAVRGEGRVEIKESTVANDLDKATPITLQDLDATQEEKRRSARVTFVLHPGKPGRAGEPGRAGAGSAPDPSTSRGADASLAVEPEPTFWELAGAMDIRKLARSDLGLLVLLILAFFFGSAHALQPGHGKTLVAAYLVGERGTIWHACMLGLVTTLTHTSSSIILAIVLPLLVPWAADTVAYLLPLVAGILVVLVAIWLLLRRLGGQADHVHLFGDHHHHHAEQPSVQRVTWWALVSLGVTGGLVPCWDALTLLTFTYVMGQLWLGLPLILAFSAGLAAVLVATGILVVKLKRFATSRWGEGRIVKALPIISAVIMLLIGLWMCQHALQQRETAPREHAAQASARGSHLLALRAQID
jgi:ABC-type nickel/cobalt efflux system permease component RcnA